MYFIGGYASHVFFATKQHGSVVQLEEFYLFQTPTLALLNDVIGLKAPAAGKYSRVLTFSLAKIAVWCFKLWLDKTNDHRDRFFLMISVFTSAKCRRLRMFYLFFFSISSFFSLLRFYALYRTFWTPSIHRDSGKMLFLNEVLYLTNWSVTPSRVIMIHEVRLNSTFWFLRY